jgi:hypothetical protein
MLVAVAAQDISLPELLSALVVQAVEVLVEE